mmetsp:Transcript_34918/g.79872  ORF Transcript_34918/g.79872 Transcript_34918/m.79872 type:complete len:287 (+) Transcript_34918:268-1128(+)
MYRVQAGEVLSGQALLAEVFAGKVVVFLPRPSTSAIRACAEECIRNVLGPLDPVSAHTLPESELKLACKRLRHAFGGSAVAQQKVHTFFRDVGLGVDDLFWDKLQLRVAPGGNVTSVEDGYGPLPAHRDTWASNLGSQVNWWMPVFDLAPNSTMEIFPDAFSKFVSNDSSAWDFRELIERRKDGLEYPHLPTASSECEAVWGQSLRLLPPPGSMVAFSGAHLHRTVPDDGSTRTTRFNVVVRTVAQSCEELGYGAPMVDHMAPLVMRQWFSNVGTGQPFGAMVVRP